MTFCSRVSGFLVAFLIGVSTHAIADGFEYDYDEKPWSEIEVRLPPFPEDGNQIAFDVGANSGVEYLIDKKSLSVAEDGVVRYTLTVISRSGAKNVSYEGMRCSTSERRYYASGRADGTWSKARSNQWAKIRGTSNNHHVELYSEYFCTPGEATVSTAEQALRVLEQGGRRR